MRKVLIITVLIIGFSTQYLSAQIVVGSKFKPFSYGEMESAVMAVQKKYEANEKRVDALIDYIFEIKEQTSDKEFLQKMDSYYKKLKSFYGQDLARMDREIREVQLGIKEEVDKYNRKNKEETEQPKKTDGYERYKGLSGIQEVNSSAPLLSEPNTSAKHIGIIKTGKVEIIRQVNKSYYYVKTIIEEKVVEGYLWAIWIK
ncbi:MAG: hypothetical protein ACK5KN_14995 [Dysgonomonas sp.]|uniref:hypothetical protein n=1 Tax=Dysgonomonas sp. TaxID=1891233 RepID=UPI003A85D3E1